MSRRSNFSKRKKNNLSILAVLLVGLLFCGLLSTTFNRTEQPQLINTIDSPTTKVDAVKTPANQVNRPEIKAAETDQRIIEGEVVGITDGDTITVLDASQIQYKIRLQGIDAPEISQPFGQASKSNLSDLIFNKIVRVILHKKDKYDRDLGTIILADKDINLEQIKVGLAWHYKDYEDEQSISERENYSNEEIRARLSSKGLWKERTAIPPGEWLAGNQNGSKTYDSDVGISDQGVLESQLSNTALEKSKKETTVYITRTGSKYHRAGCRYLSRSQILISLSEAKAGYDACSICNPP